MKGTFTSLLFKKLRAILIGLLLVVFVGNVVAQDFFSSQVNSLNGTFTVYWNNTTPPADTIIIKWDDKNPPVDMQDSLFGPNIPNSRLIPANANDKPFYIRIMKVRNNNTFQVPIFSTIFLQVTPKVSDIFGVNAIAELKWNPVLANLAGEFIVSRKGSAGWIDLDTIAYKDGATSYLYNDIIASPFCGSEYLTYEIRFIPQNNPSYYSISNQNTKGPFGDRTQPENVVNDTVSIYNNPGSPFNSKPIIGWSPSNSNDVSGYKILRKDFSATIPGYDSIATVPFGTNFYIDGLSTLNACDKKYAYAVVTIDKCGKQSSGTYISETVDKQTIKLTLPDINSCERKAYLSWNKYNGMPHGLGGYKIFRRIDLGPSILEIDIKDTTKTTYEDSYTFTNGHTYSYFVVAYSKDNLFSSSSCSQSTKFTGPNVPDVVYITKASVEANSFIRISYYSTPSKTIKKLILERSTDSINFETIDVIDTQLGGYVADTSHFDDDKVDVHKQSYYYRLRATDDCKLETISNTARSILLQCDLSESETEYKLNWNKYTSWYKGAERNKLFRTVGGQTGSVFEYRSLNSADTTFSDLLSSLDPSKEVCYWIVANENPNNPYLTNVISVSNTCCIVKEHTLFLPNAFHPGNDKNYLFHPIYTDVDTESFRMIIFNRWGQQLFETKDMDKGWDGYAKGLMVPPGLYAYIITYQDLKEKVFTKRGTVTVVR